MRTQALKPALTRVLRGTVAAAALGAVLAGCAEAPRPVKAGAAATLGDTRITTAQVRKAADEWRAVARREGLTDEDLQRAAPQLARTMADPTSPERSVLYRLIDFTVVAELAKQKGIVVTAGDVNKYIAQRGGQKQLEVDFFPWGIPPSLTRAFATRDVRLRRIVDQLQVDNGEPEAVERRIHAMIANTMRTMRLSINPRYGAIDPSSLLLSPACTTLSRRGESAAAEPASPSRPGRPGGPAASERRPTCHPLTAPADEL